jgi:hypothetical protein
MIKKSTHAPYQLQLVRECEKMWSLETLDIDNILKAFNLDSKEFDEIKEIIKKYKIVEDFDSYLAYRRSFASRLNLRIDDNFNIFRDGILIRKCISITILLSKPHIFYQPLLQE